MNRPSENERLLADVLAEERTDGLQDALWAQTLGLVRRRRRSRQARRAFAARAVVAALCWAIWRHPVPTHTLPGSPAQSCAVVRSRPLAPNALVSTQPLASDCIVASRPSAEAVQTTFSSGQPPEIDDGELLALVGSKPAALVRRGPHLAELVFVNQQDEKELVRN